MHSDFSVFRRHLDEACRRRKTKHDPICAAAVDLHFAGLRALDVYRLAQIADKLDVSVDWLLGRSDMMELPYRRTFAVILRPGPEGGFTVRVPMLPEIVTYGEDEAEALAMAEDAIWLALKDRTAHGESIEPEPLEPRIREVNWEQL